MAGPAVSHSDELEKTPLYDLHVELGARMVPFSGYEMPVQYPMGILGEHNHTRDRAGLFDVSHMGQALLEGPDHATTAAALEALAPADIVNLSPGRQRYSQLLNEAGGIVDDFMVARPADPAEDGRLMLVVNAARKQVDYDHIAGTLPAGVRLTPQPDLALLALQGPAAAGVMGDTCPDAAELAFMGAAPFTLKGMACHISRSGYTGEDGFEISVPAENAERLARVLLAHPEVAPIGLGARDSLRLEAGLCLYGNDIDESTSPVEAALAWSIQKRRRREGGFPGYTRIARELNEGPVRLRVGIQPEGRAPARENTSILDPKGEDIGMVTSGGFGPTHGGPVAMGYVASRFSETGTHVQLMVRGVARPARVSAMPAVPHRYHRPRRGN